MPRYRLLLDPWPAEFESALPLEDAGPEVPVDTTVETRTWGAVPAPQAPPATLRFVDGVRRVEARVLLEREGRLVHGLFGSLAAGCVQCGAERAEFTEAAVERHLILGDGERRDARIGAMDFAGFAAAGNSPPEVLAALQNLMRNREAALAERLAAGGPVFADGPLTYFSDPRTPVAGIVKRISAPYLPPEQFALAATLETGERTPLFLILDPHNERYSWYLRVAMGRRIDHALAGIVRVEVRAGVGVDAACRIAGLSAGQLPRCASTSLRDPRAPQNLLPVGALEEELRRRLGDPVSLRRAIERHLAEDAAA